MMTKEVEAIDPALVARMVAHFRRVVEKNKAVNDANIPDLAEVRAIEALLPTPVHPDVLLAREVIADAVMYGMGVAREPERKMPSDFREGECDNGTFISAIVSALRNARAQVSA